MQMLTKNLSNNKSTSPNFVRSGQESSYANSLVIITNDATKEKTDEISKLNKLRWTKLQTLKMKKQIMIICPLTRFTSITILQKQSIEDTKKQYFAVKLFITSHNKNQ